MARKQRARPPLTRQRTIPPDAASRAELVRALTRNILRIRDHLLRGDSWRDHRRRRALEWDINVRGEVLDLLRQEQPAVWRALCEELGLRIAPGLS